MIDVDELAATLARSLGPRSVERLSDRLIRVVVPNPRFEHDSVALAVVDASNGLVLSDGGALSSLIDDDLDIVVDALSAVGMPISVGEDGAVMALTTASEVADAIGRFAHAISSAPAVWQAANLLRTPSERAAIAATQIMGRELKQRIAQSMPMAERFTRLGRVVKARGESAKAPLVLSASSQSRPWLIASCIDLVASPQARSSAKRNTSFLFDITRELHVPKFLVVRGEAAQVDHLANVYDRDNVVTVSSEKPQQLLEEAGRALEFAIVA